MNGSIDLTEDRVFKDAPKRNLHRVVWKKSKRSIDVNTFEHITFMNLDTELDSFSTEIRLSRQNPSLTTTSAYIINTSNPAFQMIYQSNDSSFSNNWYSDGESMHINETMLLDKDLSTYQEEPARSLSNRIPYGLRYLYTMNMKMYDIHHLQHNIIPYYLRYSFISMINKHNQLRSHPLQDKTHMSDILRKHTPRNVVPYKCDDNLIGMEYRMLYQRGRRHKIPWNYRSGEKNPVNSWDLPDDFEDAKIEMPTDGFFLNQNQRPWQLGIN